jgi:hypothetical protein
MSILPKTQGPFRPMDARIIDSKASHFIPEDQIYQCDCRKNSTKATRNITKQIYVGSHQTKTNTTRMNAVTAL